ncbi:hypothetical protein ACPDG4_15680, partial [Myroides sp. C20-1]
CFDAGGNFIADSTGVVFDANTLTIQEKEPGLIVFADQKKELKVLDIRASNLIVDDTTLGLGQMNVQNTLEAIVERIEVLDNQSGTLSGSGILINTEQAVDHAVLQDVKLTIAEGAIETKHLTEKAVSSSKISSKEGTQTATDGDVLVADGQGGVTFKAIKATMPKFFYLPSIYLEVEPGFSGSRNIYADYATQFGQPKYANPKAGLKAKLPVLPASELNFFITFLDEDIFEQVSISDEGVLTYKVKEDAIVTPISYMNIVLEVREE